MNENLKYLAVGGEDSTVRVYNVKHELNSEKIDVTPYHEFSSHTGPITNVEFHKS